MLTSDTTTEAARFQRQVIASKTAEERTQMAFEMSNLVRQLLIDGINQRQPDLSPSEFKLVLIERLHGRDVADAVAASGIVADGS